MGKDPREEDQEAIERERQILQVQTEIFETKKQELNIFDGGVRLNLDPLPGAFDNIDEEDEETSALMPAAATLVIEAVAIGLPSAIPATSGHTIRAVEMKLRTLQAAKYLQQLQETIAEKSFQYSHTMRKAPRKGVRTRARTAIAKLNDRLTTLSRGYMKCRHALISLGADEQILQLYKALRKEDVKSSTAILDANIPGASKIRLSWIWQTDADKDPNSSPEAVKECRSDACCAEIEPHVYFQIFAYITCAVEHRRCVGKKNINCLNMRWNGQRGGLLIKLSYGIVGHRQRIEKWRHLPSI